MVKLVNTLHLECSAEAWEFKSLYPYQAEEGMNEGKIRRLQALRRYREVQVPTDFGHATCGV